jgi:hypothetical protein
LGNGARFGAGGIRRVKFKFINARPGCGRIIGFGSAANFSHFGFLTKAGGSVPGCEFVGSPSMKAFFRRGCN